MTILERIGRLYIRGSIHVALSVVAMVGITQILFDIPFRLPVICFTFISSLAAYNFVKFHTIFHSRRGPTETRLIALMSFCLLPIGGLCFFHLSFDAQLIVVLLTILTVTYALPFLGRPNVRNLSGVKIYLVALCWTGFTVAVPALDGNVEVNGDFWILLVQRFILIIVLLLIFDIVDMPHDKPSLQTVPQQIGIRQTKIVGYILLLIFVMLDGLRVITSMQRITTLIFTALLTALFLYHANASRPKSYTAFWVESIPIVWFAILLAFD